MKERVRKSLLKNYHLHFFKKGLKVLNNIDYIKLNLEARSMSIPLLVTKYHIPSLRTKVVLRPRLVENLNEGLYRKLTLISAPAGFGKTTLVSEWVSSSNRPTAWLSLDEGDNDPSRFLAYLSTALQTIEADIGESMLDMLKSRQSPPNEAVLTAFINGIAGISDDFIIVLDDYHLIDSKEIDNILSFLLNNLPSQVHFLITTRETPQIPLARLRIRGELTEICAGDLRFTQLEAEEFLNQIMDLNLSPEDITELENRTEGWIAGLQLAALSMKGHKDVKSFIKSFTGSHHLVLDYFLEEVLEQQPESIQTFLLRTSILDRLCGSLCDAILVDSQLSGQETLEYLERANLFIIPLDNERGWYRYHHLFADLLRKRLKQSISSYSGDREGIISELHKRASRWFEDNDLEIEAFHHAAVGNDIERAEYLIEGKGMPLHFRGAVLPVLNWLESLPTDVLDARPSLWVTYASVLLGTGQTSGIEQKLKAAEAAIQNNKSDEMTQDILGRIAATRAMLALSQHNIDTIITQSHRALKYLHFDNLPYRTATTWKLGYAYQIQGDRVKAKKAYIEALSTSRESGNFIINQLALTGLGNIQEVDTQLYLAGKTYRSVLKMEGKFLLPAAACEAHLGLARIYYEWNKIDLAQQHVKQSIQLAPQLQNTDRLVACKIFLVHLKVALGELDDAESILDEITQKVHSHNYINRMSEVAAERVLVLLHRGNLVEAERLAQEYSLSISQARINLTRGDTFTALTLLVKLRQQLADKGWEDEKLRAMILQAAVLYEHGEKDKAVQVLAEALAMAEQGGFIRSFIDEGFPMAQLLSRVVE